MPGPKTHDIFYREFKRKLSLETLSSFPHYDQYRIFAQGHDFLIYHDFYKIFNQKRLDKNVENSELLQEFYFPEFVYQYLKMAERMDVIEDEQVRLFIGPGYIMHHMLDAYTHPLIIYYAGDHTRDPKRDTWQHGIVETLLDIYLMAKKEGKDASSYPVYKDFSFDVKRIRKALIAILDESLKSTYQIQNGGKIFLTAMGQVELFTRHLKCDPNGAKRKLFDSLDPILKGTSSFSYHRNIEEVYPYLNEEHALWLNPMDASVESHDSFMDLYDKALIDGACMVDSLEKLCKKGAIHRDDVYSIIPNIASTHGLEGNQKIKIRNTKKW